MKVILARFLLPAVLFASVTLLFGEDFKSKVIAGSNFLIIHVPAGQFLVIRNFTQEADASTIRGVVTASIDGQNVNVLTAAILDTTSSTPPEIINKVIIAGGADVTVTCGASTGNCFVSYKKENNN